MTSAISILSRLAEVLESGRGMNDREGLYINYHTAHCHEIAKFMVPSDMQKEYLVKATEGYEKVVSSRVFGELPKTKQASILDCLAYAGLASVSMARQSAYEYEQRALSILSSDGELRSFFHTRHALATVRIASLFLDKNIVHGIDHPRREGFKCLKIALEHPNFIAHLSYDQQDHVGVELLSLYHSGDGDIAFGSSDYRDFVEQITQDRVRQVLDQPPSAIRSEGMRPAEARVPSPVFPMSAAMRGQETSCVQLTRQGLNPLQNNLL